MMRCLPDLVVLLATIPSTSAFSPPIQTKANARLYATALNYHPGTYDRALDCANNYGMCGIDELLDLSEELDEYLGCYAENGPDACAKEVDDRQDLSEALLVQGEMREHEIYVQEGNFFDYNENGNAYMNGDEKSILGTQGRMQEGEFFRDDSTLGP